MSGRVTFLAAAILLAGQEIAAAQGCATAIIEFRDIVNTETSMGHARAQAKQASTMVELSLHPADLPRRAQLRGADRPAGASAPDGVSLERIN